MRLKYACLFFVLVLTTVLGKGIDTELEMEHLMCDGEQLKIPKSFKVASMECHESFDEMDTSMRANFCMLTCVGQKIGMMDVYGNVLKGTEEFFSDIFPQKFVHEFIGKWNVCVDMHGSIDTNIEKDQDIQHPCERYGPMAKCVIQAVNELCKLELPTSD